VLASNATQGSLTGSILLSGDAAPTNFLPFGTPGVLRHTRPDERDEANHNRIVPRDDLNLRSSW
jgi:hypothetical protein